ncbi:MAG: efflux RND transporter periplasmic adaptor subunit [Oceanipulchritudo sp.]
MNNKTPLTLLKTTSFFTLGLCIPLFLSGCGDHGHPHDDHGHDQATEGHDAHGATDEHADHDDHSDEVEPVVVTQYTDNSELFMEHPPLVRGKPVRLIVHLTRLSDFTPITEGSLEVRLIPATGQPHSVIDDAPARDGIFLPEITLPFAGKATMELILRSPQMSTSHRLESVSVYASAEEVPHAHDEDESPNAISFLKEQQWRIDFATEPAVSGPLHPAIQAYGTLRLPPSGKAIVPAPADGIVKLADGAAFEVGKEFEENATLFSITPDSGWSEGLANLREEYLLARLELERVQSLFKQEAVAEKRVEEATIKLRTLADALQRLGVDMDSVDAQEFRALVRSPMSGHLAEIYVHPGQRVASGDSLALVVDPSRLVLEATVPITRLERFTRATDAIFHMDNGSRSYRISELGGSVVSRLPQPSEQAGFARFLFQFSNPGHQLIPGSKVSVHVLGENSDEAVIIPLEAVNEEQGQPLVYVHTAGETVEKRYPRLGDSDGRHIAVLTGIEEGERVVTHGANAIRLSSLSTTEMGHGHAH